ncbi:hypothetical protein L9F63_027482, partial [Diploptera punctata]
YMIFMKIYNLHGKSISFQETRRKDAGVSIKELGVRETAAYESKIKFNMCLLCAVLSE